jgi:hypothetical protein
MTRTRSLRSPVPTTSNADHSGAMRHRGRLATLAAGATIGFVVLTASPALAVPPAIEAPSGIKYVTLHADGYQRYSCQPSGWDTGTWVFDGPEATLYDSSGAVFGQHGLDGASGLPFWDGGAGGRVVARKVASAPSPSGAIPWLLLQTTDVQAGTTFNSFTNYVQRVNTVGGQAPDFGCSYLGVWLYGWYSFSHYTADYNFFYNFG